jgi:hypothetical protein
MNDRHKTTKCIAPGFFFRFNWGNKVNKCSEGDNGYYSKLHKSWKINSQKNPHITFSSYVTHIR